MIITKKDKDIMTKTTKKQTKKQIANELAEFFERYAAILYAMREFVLHVANVAARSGESPYVTTREVAEHIASHAPAAYLKTFGADEPRSLKVWRVKSLLYNASFLGAYDALGVAVRRGKGLTADTSGRRRGLRVIAGGKS